MAEAPFLQALDILRAGGNSRRLPAGVIAEAGRAFKRWAPWSRQRSVQGFGVARRSVAGRRTGELALKVYVERKLPLGAAENPIPREIEVPGLDPPIPIDVEQIGHMQPHSHTYARRPAYGGLGISHEKGPTGTLACLLRRIGRPDEVYVLGNAHILARAGFAEAGDRILQPPVEYGGTDADTIATLVDWTRFDLSPGAENRCDAAIAVARKGVVSARIGDLGIPTGATSLVFEGDVVRLAGAISDQQTARVLDAHYAPTLPYSRPNGVPFDVSFVDQVLCERYSQPGDSGAAVLDAAGRLVGLHLAGSESRSCFNRIDHVLGYWGDLEVVTAEPWPAVTASMKAAAGRKPPVGGGPEALDVLARTLWGEARSEDAAAIEAIAAAAVNRALRPGAPAGERTIEAVCRAPDIFRCWTAGNPVLAGMLKVSAANVAFQETLRVARRALDGTLADRVRGATRYHRVAETPPWAHGRTPCAAVGIFIFYDMVD